MIDGNKNTYWATDDKVKQATVEFTFKKPTAINRVLLQEYIKLGQRVKAFSIEAKIDGQWKTIANETTIGYKRILRLDRVTATALRVNVLDAKAGFVISTIEAYNAPTFVKEPHIGRDKNGLVTIKSEEGTSIYYTLDGKTPSEKSTLYKAPFTYNKAVEIKAIARNTKEKINSVVKSAKYGVSKEKWKIVSVSSGDDKSAERIIDGDANTDWAFGNDENKLPQTVVIDMGELVSIKGFTYTPQQVGNNLNLISNYELYTSVDNFYWDKQSEGEFSNIKHNPIEQIKSFSTVKARFLKFVATSAVGKAQTVSIAEIGVVE